MEELEPKDKILKGAESLFMKYGVRSITMDDIARQLGVSKKTLYQHFADKEDIVTQVCTQNMHTTLKQFEQIKETSENAVEELAKLSMCLKQNMEETNPSLLFDLQKYHPRAWAAWIEFKQKNIYDSVKRNLDQGIAEHGNHRRIVCRSRKDGGALTRLRSGAAEKPQHRSFQVSCRFLR